MFKNEGAYINIANKSINMRLIVRSMSCIVLLLFGTYISLTGKTIYNVVNKKNIEQDIASTRSHIAVLENDLFSYYNSIHKETLSEYGFVQYDNEVYVTGDSVFVLNQ